MGEKIVFWLNNLILLRLGPGYSTGFLIFCQIEDLEKQEKEAEKYWEENPN